MTSINTTLIVREPGKTYSIVGEEKPVVSVINLGTKGIKGEKGEYGDAHFKYTQGSASEEWLIVHNLDKYPSVTVQDSANENVEGFCEYINNYELVLTFSAAFSGVAYLN